MIERLRFEKIDENMNTIGMPIFAKKHGWYVESIEELYDGHPPIK